MLEPLQKPVGVADQNDSVLTIAQFALVPVRLVRPVPNGHEAEFRSVFTDVLRKLPDFLPALVTGGNTLLQLDARPVTKALCVKQSYRLQCTGLVFQSAETLDKLALRLVFSGACQAQDCSTCHCSENEPQTFCGER